MFNNVESELSAKFIPLTLPPDNCIAMYLQFTHEKISLFNDMKDKAGRIDNTTLKTLKVIIVPLPHILI